MRCLAILAESDAAFRRLLEQVLAGVLCEVEACSNAPQLRADLLCQSGAGVERLLLVSSTALASSCTHEIDRVSRARSECGLTPVQVLFTCEFGDLERPFPELGAAELVGMLEKPFDISVFEELVRSSLVPKPSPRAIV